MEVVLYIVIGLLAIAAAWWGLKVGLGMLLPIEKTARAYMLQLLRKMELSEVVPASYVNEGVAESIQFARTSANVLGKKDQIQTETVKQLELHAEMLGFWVHGTDPFDAVYKSRFKEMFERHRVPRVAR